MLVIITYDTPEEERLLAGNIHPLHSATLYLVGGGVPGPIATHIRDLNSLLLLLLLLLLDYPIAPPLTPIPMPSHPSLSSGKDEGQFQLIQNGNGLPSGMRSSDDVSLR